MNASHPKRWLRDARRAFARLPSLRITRVPDAPALPVRDPWPGDPTRGARLLRGELEVGGAARDLRPGAWGAASNSALLDASAHSFSWLRDLRALGTDAARLRARALVAEWVAMPPNVALAHRPDIVGARITAWLAHYDFFAATADDVFRQRLMGRLVADARSLAAALPAEELDARALTALKGLVAAAVALPDHAGYLTRALRFLPQELARQVLPDGCHVERSPTAQLAALQDLTEIRALLQAAQAQPPPSLGSAIERMAPALRIMRHGDGGLALFNGSREESSSLIDLALTQAGRGVRGQSVLADGGFQRLQAGRSLLIVDCGVPPPVGVDRYAHAGTLSMELSVGRDRMIVNCGSFPAGSVEWRDATRATAAHSTLVIADVSSSELKPVGLGHRPTVVEAQHQEANGAHWLEASHDGYARRFGFLHRRQLLLAGDGRELRGDDMLLPAGRKRKVGTIPFAIRFHLGAGVEAAPTADGMAALLRLPSGRLWQFRCRGGSLTIEESLWIDPDGRPVSTQQLVVSGEAAAGGENISWALKRAT